MTSRTKGLTNLAQLMPSIDLREYLEPLKELSEIDNRLRTVEREFQQIPVELETSGGEYVLLSKALKEKELRLEVITKERLALEEEAKQLGNDIDEKEKRLYAIKTQKEYQATLKEIAKVKQENKQREGRILAILEETEKNSSETTQLKSNLADKEGEFKKVETELNTKKEALLQEQVGLKERRPKVLDSLHPEILKKYDGVKKRFSNPVAAVLKGVCQGCNMNIPPQVYNEILKVNDLRHCPNCHRLIYVVV